MPDDRDWLAAAIEELYGGAPEAFTGRRGELVSAAREAGDRAAAKAIGELRRPTRAAWVVNQLSRADPSAPRKLAELSAALSAAQRAGHGPRLRELSAARGALVDALTVQALSLARVTDAPSALREEVSGTLTAAVADPGVAAEFSAGTLTRAAQWSGFGVLPAAGAGEVTSPVTEQPVELGAGAGQRVPADRAAAAGARVSAPLKVVGHKTGAREAAPPRAGARDAAAAETAARRQAEAEARLAREAAERAARRREQYEDAERAVASASAAATEAVAAEDRLEGEVRQLEQRVTEARSELAAARMRARHAEAAERRARQAFERLAQ